MNRNWTILTTVIAVSICLAGFTHHSIAQGKQKLPDLKKVMVDHPDDPSKKISLANLVKGYKKKGGSADVGYPMNRAGVCVVSIDFYDGRDEEDVVDNGTWHVPVHIAQNRVINLLDEIELVKRERFIQTLIDGIVADPDVQGTLLAADYFFGCYNEDTIGCAERFNETLGADVFTSTLSINREALKNHLQSLLFDASISYSNRFFGCEQLTCWYDDEGVSLIVNLVCEGGNKSSLSTTFTYDELRPFLVATSPLQQL